MAARDRYSRKLECSECGNAGFADVSESDERRADNRDFRIDDMPAGFYAEFPSSDPRRYVIRCHCGYKFKFERKSAYPPGGEPR